MQISYKNSNASRKVPAMTLPRPAAAPVMSDLSP